MDKIRIPVVGIKMPHFWGFRLPMPGGIYLGGGKLILVGFSTVVVGFVASMFVLINTGEQQITWPMTGASYINGSMVGANHVDPEFPADKSQTLQLYFGDDLRLDEVTFRNISLGKAGLTDAFSLQGIDASNRIIIDELIIMNSEFPSFDIASSTAYSVVAQNGVTAAGHTFTITLDASVDDITVGSGRGSASYIAENMIVDRILMTQTSGSTIIDTLILDNVNAFTGTFNGDQLTIGTLTIQNSKFGDDGDINSADLILNLSANNVADGVVEAPINIQ